MVVSEVLVISIIYGRLAMSVNPLKFSVHYCLIGLFLVIWNVMIGLPIVSSLFFFNLSCLIPSIFLSILIFVFLSTSLILVFMPSTILALPHPVSAISLVAHSAFLFIISCIISIISTVSSLISNLSWRVSSIPTIISGLSSALSLIIFTSSC